MFQGTSYTPFTQLLHIGHVDVHQINKKDFLFLW